jgi:hypothetical protein
MGATTASIALLMHYRYCKQAAIRKTLHIPGRNAISCWI